MVGERTVMQEALFYKFSLEHHIPSDHLLCSIDRFVDLSGSHVITIRDDSYRLREKRRAGMLKGSPAAATSSAGNWVMTA
ncbi:hypothetical protein [Azospirillum sp.]|uniref:hypothetical protein n=1 Tax=Azospirillum sp. TaxID=34012 RepID=UPI002D27207A|nr:hypothetical protein [Azospirillum sp.]HYD65134.1 hypothetical protein [Azospirillum sp.]